MDAGCLRPETLAAYQEGRLQVSEAETLEQHALACSRCQDLLLLLGNALDAEGLPVSSASLGRLKTLSRGQWPWKAVAAALLLMAAGAAWLALDPRQHQVEGGARAKAPEGMAVLPEGPIGNPDLPSASLSRGVDLLLDRGARAVWAAAGRRLHAEAGSLWLEVSRGEPLRLELPGATLTLDRGSLAVFLPELPPQRLGWLLREARAAEASEGKVWILDGEAVAKTSGRTLPLGPGTRLLLPGAGKGWQKQPCPPGEMEALREARCRAAASLPGRELLAGSACLTEESPSLAMDGGAPPSFRWVSVLSGRHPSTEVGLSFRVEGSWYQWPVGLGAEPPRAREVLEVTFDGERVTGRVNGRISFSTDREGLAKVLMPSGRSSWGVSAWGGRVNLTRSTIQEAR